MRKRFMTALLSVGIMILPAGSGFGATRRHNAQTARHKRSEQPRARVPGRCTTATKSTEGNKPQRRREWLHAKSGAEHRSACSPKSFKAHGGHG